MLPAPRYEQSSHGHGAYYEATKFHAVVEMYFAIGQTAKFRCPEVLIMGGKLRCATCTLDHPESSLFGANFEGYSAETSHPVAPFLSLNSDCSVRLLCKHRS